jgi:translation initiation factor eIF-2B subunit epsilon
LGKDGAGCVWHGDDEEADLDDEEIDPRQRAITELGKLVLVNEINSSIKSLIYGIIQLKYLTNSTIASTLAGFDFEEGLTSESSDEEDDSDLSEIGGEDEFNYEVAQTFERAVAEKHSIEVAALELNTLRMSYNANYHTIRQLLIPVMLRHVDMSNMSASLKKASTLSDVVNR